ncbi:dihydrofolate reductase [Anaerospora hongkongensis]|uniref:dihydrofolate reductase n=1 Tax=Anaerospora hongkongensis TaxID=244830 RepID=UPI0028A1C908|nr:dihydrofolate reductase [Anaerospora hongkongensis]
MNLIAAVDGNWGIGNKCELLQIIPQDMQHFKALTTGSCVVMGRTTFESLPRRQPLPDRINVVLSTTYKDTSPGIVVCASLAELFRYLKQCEKDIYVIGGEAVYRQLMPFCTDAYITKIRQCFIADRHLPNLDEAPGWECVEEGSWQRYKEWDYRFIRYKNLAALCWK